MPSVLITGAGRGLGLEFARQYKDEGWRVIGTVRDPAKEAALRELGVEPHRLDVADIPAITALGRALQAETIDVLIVNAGMMGPRDMSLDRIDQAAWEEAFRVNVIAPLAFAGAFLVQVKRSAQRKMIAISSRRGSMTCNDSGGRYIYRSSKAALNAGWRSLAVDQPELVAILLHPGWVRTDLGGPSADLSPEVSVAGMRRVIAAAGKAESGRFFDYSGDELPW